MCWRAAGPSLAHRYINVGIATGTTAGNKERYRQLSAQYARADQKVLTRALRQFYAPEVSINVVHPINTINGIDEFVLRVIEPMHASFGKLQRRTDMLFGGEFEGNEWLVSHGHYLGNFEHDWMGIPASGDVAWLHYAEFHRIANGRSAESYLYFDLLDLLRQIGRWPLSTSLGHEGFVPGPATADGIAINENAPEESLKSLQMVDDMLARLYTDDEAWRPYWHPHMMWFGPSGYGSFIGVDGFAKFQLPYEAIFDKNRVRTTYIQSGDATLDRAVRGHYTRFADGNYVASGGWPSHGGFLASDWLGVRASGQMFTVRVADIWRRDGERLAENWVFVDVIEMLHQLGRDVFADADLHIDIP